jgi:hypothetical protein
MEKKSVSGFVRYEINVSCPHCQKNLDLNSWPYDDDQEVYGPAEDELGLALFGRVNEPAKWSGIANAEEYGMLNAICRVASKAMTYGLPMMEIADQLDKSRLSDSRTWVADLAMVLRECA